MLTGARSAIKLVKLTGSGSETDVEPEGTAWWRGLRWGEVSRRRSRDATGIQVPNVPKAPNRDATGVDGVRNKGSPRQWTMGSGKRRELP